MTIMPNTKYNSKIVYFGETLMDLTEDMLLQLSEEG